MLRNWFNRSNSTSSSEQRKTIQGAVAIVGIGVAALCMWQNAQTPYLANANLNLLAENEEMALPPAPESDAILPPSRIGRILPDPMPASTLDQLVVHVDKHGNIDVAGELINPELFRSLLTSVKQDSPGDVSVLIHANEKCEVSTIQKVVDVCEECLTSYRLRIEDSRSQSKPTKPADTSTRA